MKYFYIIIIISCLATSISSCQTNYTTIKRVEIQVNYPHIIYGRPIKHKKQKRKIEYRIYNQIEKLIELGEYGADKSYSISKWNPIDSTLEITNYNVVDPRKLRCMEQFKYDEKGRISKRSRWRCSNKMKYLLYQEIFNYEMDTIHRLNYNYNGEFIDSSNHKMVYPKILTDNIYNQKATNRGSRILLTEKQEFVYDKEKRLVKILYKDRYNKLLGYTKYHYKKYRHSKCIKQSHRNIKKR